jgi:hypothetical protein
VAWLLLYLLNNTSLLEIGAGQNCGDVSFEETGGANGQDIVEAFGMVADHF